MVSNFAFLDLDMPELLIILAIVLLNLPFFCRFHGMFWYTVPPPQALLPARII
jgi:hypothetical protein